MVLWLGKRIIPGRNGGEELTLSWIIMKASSQVLTIPPFPWHRFGTVGSPWGVKRCEIGRVWCPRRGRRRTEANV